MIIPKNRRNQLLSICIFLIALIISECKKDEIVDPPKVPSHPTITWTADTIRNPREGAQLRLSSIWGSETNDVYAIGYNMAGGNASLFHFNGKQWSVVKITQSEGGFIGSYVSFTRIDGSSKNDVWAVGYRGGYYGSMIDSSLVIHFDGVSWKEVSMERCKGVLQDIRVFAPNDIYLSGEHGEIYHFDGINFSKSILDTNLSFLLGGDPDRVFAGGKSYSLFPNDYIGIYSKKKNKIWQVIKQTTVEDYYKSKNYGQYDFYPIGGGKYFSGGEGIFILNDTIWQSSYTKENYPYYRIRGTSSINIFALSGFNRILHWNGIDWKALNIPEGLGDVPIFGGLWVKGNAIFISCYYTFDVNIIYRGTYQLP